MRTVETRSAAEISRTPSEEYGTILRIEKPFALESGEILPAVDVAFETYGTLNAEGSNAILVCHALTGNARVGDRSTSGGPASPGWWSGIIGAGKGLNTDRNFVVCSNILGSCYGTTGPTSTNPSTGKPYRTTFPQMNVRDMVRLQYELLRSLGIRHLAGVIGGSLGGMQVLEWAILYPDFVGAIIPVATAAKHSAWCIGFDESQRLAITSDPDWKGGSYEEQPEKGLSLARMIAMISYRSRNSFEARFGREGVGSDRQDGRVFREEPPLFQVESYLRYQGEKLVDRFDANTYLYLTRAMDLHDVGIGRGSVADALGTIRARALCVGVSSDILYPASEQREIAKLIPRAKYAEIDSPHGHDAFLIEFDQLNALLRSFLG